ncbi:hypothetical protein CRG98_031869 [Punica granatum]|uniref:Uncharacterized protein n=1 Tax=Punica granatum TaxID=22663 RepID=A0A2I0IWH0_PUNGR|nr:hypothetical protein CRG98_031869 [Punica granatum]
MANLLKVFLTFRAGRRRPFETFPFFPPSGGSMSAQARGTHKLSRNWAFMGRTPRNFPLWAVCGHILAHIFVYGPFARPLSVTVAPFRTSGRIFRPIHPIMSIANRRSNKRSKRTIGSGPCLRGPSPWQFVAPDGSVVGDSEARDSAALIVSVALCYPEPPC